MVLNSNPLIIIHIVIVHIGMHIAPTHTHLHIRLILICTLHTLCRLLYTFDFGKSYLSFRRVTTLKSGVIFLIRLKSAT